ncbi:hypothetical protein HDF16_001926 [Granulicella aggregans]|uniref:Uncharacterized protein n=1 Tax=Granulicella aggregans TaxID=474949 RepID=A0A7W8E3A2_9BACT|nr:hypothetical protein [Granulicella aggregans]MBB5057241.1 hypothetical protein [Granulicella aggregans]
MTLTIDNLTGLGPLDYTAAIAADTPFALTRTLNAPSILTGILHLNAMPTPSRRARLTLTSDNGTTLFTGYIATEPAAIYAGDTTTGPVFRYKISAVSDEWLLDKQPLPYLGTTLAAPAGTALRALTARVEPGLFTTSGVAAGRAIGVFSPSSSATWSENAGTLANAAYSAYRVVAGALSFQPAGNSTHALNFDSSFDGGGTASFAALNLGQVKELANDVTLSGDIEPAAYISETFAGDGVTTIFQLSEAPFRATAAAARTPVADTFDESVINPQIWSVADPGSHLTLGAGGLTLNGGNGIDGQTTLSALDPVEIAGSLLLEAGGLTLSGANQGVLCGLFNGPVSVVNCFAGYNIRNSSGTTLLTPLINGVEVGTTFTIAAGHTYTLRVRLNCPEQQRLLQTYYCMVDGIVESFGAGATPSPASLVFDILDTGTASNTPATILYDGSTAAPITSTPASCIFAAVDCAQLFGSIAYIRVTRPSSAFIVSTLPSGTKQSRLIGVAGEGTDCTLDAAGKITFFAGQIPVAGETFTVTYRNRQRSVTRIQNATSVASEAAATSGTASGPVSGIARWIGKVLKPAARSTADLEAAAQALLAFATSHSAALAGTYTSINPQQTGAGNGDIWPGDVLALTQNGTTTSVIVRKVEIDRSPAFPELLTYKIAFANDWAEALGLTLSESIAADAILSTAPTTIAQLTAGTVLPNLPQLQLTSATSTALQIDAGLTPPSGGGFEVRRRDNAFGPSIAQDLVLRSPVRSFSIPRAAQLEKYYVRMYDASTPPLYSRFSSAIFINLPIS